MSSLFRISVRLALCAAAIWFAVVPDSSAHAQEPPYFVTYSQVLEEPGNRLADIAKFIGYTNASSFSRTFVRLMKIQPVVYRRQQLARKHLQAFQRE